MKTNYRSFIDRLNECNSMESVEKMEALAEKLLCLGVFSIAQFNKADHAVILKKLKIETK